MLRSFFKSLVLPPLSLFVLGALGFAVRKKRPVLGKILMSAAVGLLFLLCLPVVAAALAISLQTIDALDPEQLPEGPQAVVVLGCDFYPHAPEYGGSTVGMLSLERSRYGAFLARQTGLPVMTTGGRMRKGERPIAEFMQDVLETDFGVEVRWTETRSFNTRENVQFAAEILAPEGVERIFLVTHAWHMPRAVAAAEAAGFEVTPACTSYRSWPPVKPSSALPSARALRESTWALHEWIGRVWYALTG
jgi:uncharacterized SAM-binding protein YcdF (DUF218 family)